MTLESIKQEIEKRTKYRFEYKVNILGNDVLNLLGLPKGNRIEIGINNYSESVKGGAEYIGISGMRGKPSYSGFGSPCDDIETVITTLENNAEKYGWQYVATQMEMF